MSELKIPEAAYAAGEAGYDESCRLGLRADGIGAAVDAAAPLIVAAELRQLSQDMNLPPEMSLWLRIHADELDPQGVTK